MKGILRSVRFRVLCGLAALVSLTAAVGVASASAWFLFQPELPENTQR